MNDLEKHFVLRKFVDKWLPLLGLSDWIINIETSDKYSLTEGCEADIQDDIKYHEADLCVYPLFWESDHQEQIIVHELTHLVFCRLHPYLPPAADDLLEEVVQTTAMIFYKKICQS